MRISLLVIWFWRRQVLELIACIRLIIDILVEYLSIITWDKTRKRHSFIPLIIPLNKWAFWSLIFYGLVLIALRAKFMAVWLIRGIGRVQWKPKHNLSLFSGPLSWSWQLLLYYVPLVYLLLLICNNSGTRIWKLELFGQLLRDWDYWRWVKMLCGLRIWLLLGDKVQRDYVGWCVVGLTLRNSLRVRGEKLCVVGCRFYYRHFFVCDIIFQLSCNLDWFLCSGKLLRSVL